MRIDLTGQVFDRLSVVKLSHVDKHGKTFWECVCKCGNKHVASSTNLRNMRVRSCGCLKRIHGMNRTRPYWVWNNMLNRCNDLQNSRYPLYGGRGITVCDKWSTFAGFWEDMKEGYSDQLTLDRVDSNGNYCKKNCRWVTAKEQSRNRRSNVKYCGECAVDASIRLGGKPSLVSLRIRNGWSKKRAFTTPVIK